MFKVELRADYRWMGREKRHVWSIEFVGEMIILESDVIPDQTIEISSHYNEALGLLIPKVREGGLWILVVATVNVQLGNVEYADKTPVEFSIPCYGAEPGHLAQGVLRARERVRALEKAIYLRPKLEGSKS